MIEDSAGVQIWPLESRESAADVRFRYRSASRAEEKRWLALEPEL
jgi:hypothetical protein